MRRALVALAVAAALTAGPAATAEAATQPGRSLVATLHGRDVVGRPGDPDGIGRARITVNTAEQQVCYRLDVSRIDDATQAHVHRGRAGENGAVVVALKSPQRGRVNGCAGVSREIARDLLRQPNLFYVDVHTRQYPDGAVRGQLH
ncbi:CHRD domain-containing protein [Georgenia thermotolerans]|uniref:CHRD domain-containing protein n=1 Tax=Georgenia thermotolerans TaxID=527326 RepID=A0A7J5UNQ7_9MICO|nr:CHRD domain-containing protein [Georgenia thermotolerans]KAE8764036.1 CHRD domain-containing protein [Georgenia thermotolerans]